MKDDKKFWERFAFLYTPMMKTNDRVFDKVCDEFSKYLSSDMNVLESACGTGQITFRLAEKVNHWTATDFSPKMVEQSRKRNKFENISFSVEDATALSYDDNTFDAVVISNALHIMPNPEKALQEIHRVLKPDGKLFSPTFVFEKNASDFKIRFMKKFGFTIYHEWDSEQLAKYIESFGFKNVKRDVIPASPLPESIIISQKI